LGGFVSGCGGSGSGGEEADPPAATQAGTSQDTSAAATTGAVETNTATVDTATAEEPADAGPQPIPAGGAQPLDPGEYVTSIFNPVFAFAVDQPVATAGPELPNAVALDLGTVDAPTALTFINDSMTLFDPQSDHTEGPPVADPAKVTSPESLVTWLTEHSRLEAGEPTEVTIGGVPATEVTVEVAEGEGYTNALVCNPSVECVVLLGTPQFSYFAELGTPIRFQVLETGGRTLAILTEAPDPGFAAAAALADQLLATVTFE
jgi:hypothetical protein